MASLEGLDLMSLNLRSCEGVTGNITSLERCVHMKKLVLVKCPRVDGDMSRLLKYCREISPQELKVEGSGVVVTTSHALLKSVGI